MTTKTLREAIDGDPTACRALVALLAPVIRRRVLRALGRARGRARHGTRAPADVDDLVQEVMIALFDNDARTLRAWDPERGASLRTFVSLVADRRIASVLRSAARRPWGAEVLSDTGTDTVPCWKALPDDRAASKDYGRRLVHRLKRELSPRGVELFFELLVHEQPVATVCRERNMSVEAVWAWRSRLKKLVRKVGTELEELGTAPREKAIPVRDAASLRGAAVPGGTGL